MGVLFNDAMKFVDEFVEASAALINTEMSKEQFKLLSSLDPSINKDLEIISTWNTGVVINETIDTDDENIESDVEENVEISITENGYVATPVEKTRHMNKKLTTDDVIKISKYIVENLIGSKISSAESQLYLQFPEVTLHTLSNLLNKKTHVNKTNQYFSIDKKKKIIISLDEPVLPEVPEEEKPIPRDNIFTVNDVTEKIPKMLTQSGGDLITLISDDMTAKDIEKLAITRYVMYQKGTYQDIGSGVKEIITMSVMANTHMMNNQSIRKYIKEKYNLDVRPLTISSVKNGRVFKSIARRFEVI
jgi:hypothetical protein